MHSNSSVLCGYILVRNLHNYACSQHNYACSHQQPVVCNIVPLDLWWHVCSFGTAMRTHTSVKPARLQVLSEYVLVLQTELFVLKQIFLLFWWWYKLPWEPTQVRSLQNTGALRVYLSKTTIICNDKHISTGIMVASSQFLQCHENTCWWEAWTTTGAVRMYLSYKHDCL